MKPLLYFAHCPQTEAIEALNWTNGLTDMDKARVARTLVAAFNHAIGCSFLSKVQCFVSFDIEAAGFECNLPIVDKIAKVADGMPIDYCRGCIDYFNQF